MKAPRGFRVFLGVFFCLSFRYGNSLDGKGGDKGQKGDKISPNQRREFHLVSQKYA